MSVAATSIKAWFEVNVEGITQDQQQHIYREIYTSLRPATCNEISKVVDIPASTVAARLNAMADDGHVVRCDKRPCKHTGRTAVTWRSK